VPAPLDALASHFKAGDAAHLRLVDTQPKPVPNPDQNFFEQLFMKCVVESIIWDTSQKAYVLLVAVEDDEKIAKRIWVPQGNLQKTIWKAGDIVCIKANLRTTPTAQHFRFEKRGCTNSRDDHRRSRQHRELLFRPGQHQSARTSTPRELG
jgi:hypothetical protein